MDHSMKESWIMEKPPKASYPTRLLDNVRESTNASIYRFEVTYGLYVMDFWEKTVVYTFTILCLGFLLWTAVIPLSTACFRLVSRHLALEPKGLYSVLERPSQKEFTGILIRTGLDAFNGSGFNASSPAIHM